MKERGNQSSGYLCVISYYKAYFNAKPFGGNKQDRTVLLCLKKIAMAIGGHGLLLTT